MLHQQIKASLKEAMMAKDETKLAVIRGLLTSFTNELITKGRKPQDMLTDEEALTVIARATKQRKDSIDQFKRGGRSDLAEDEQLELDILQTYLPAQMSEDEIKAFVAKKKTEMGIDDKSKVNMLMKAVMVDLKGKADGSLVKAAVDASFV